MTRLSQSQAAARLTRLLEQLGLGPARTRQEPPPPPIVCTIDADLCGSLGIRDRESAGRLGVCCRELLRADPSVVLVADAGYTEEGDQ